MGEGLDGGAKKLEEASSVALMRAKQARQGFDRKVFLDYFVECDEETKESDLHLTTPNIGLSKDATEERQACRWEVASVPGVHLGELTRLVKDQLNLQQKWSDADEQETA
ncbi:MAG: hypothetical protein M1830_000106 [Pleopsidium flavum]|nr:MAG: hypothetical protein M1830_000106 [Pleopsidium flavum]